MKYTVDTSPWSFRIGLLLVLASPCSMAQNDPRHYVFFGFDRERIRKETFLKTSAFEGAQLKYSWKELEPKFDEYDFSMILSDLECLQEAGKRLFIQLQEVSFNPDRILVPDYLREDERYGGGVEVQYAFENDDESKAVPEGWVARRWDLEVQNRFHKLLAAMGRELDGKIEGVNLPESIVSFGWSGDLHPEGFSFDRYRSATIENMAALKSAFPKGVTIQYANFMPAPGDEVPEPYLQDVYRAARELGVGVGGPDIIVNKWWQMQHSYPLIRDLAGVVPTGVAVQWGNYEAIDPRSGKQVSISDIYDFARDYLGLDYVFWCTQAPFFREGVVPFLTLSE